MSISKAALALSFCIALTACFDDGDPNANVDQKNNASQQQVDEADIAARVNGEVITKEELNTYKTMQNNPGISDAKLLDELIATELLRQEAEKEGILKQPDVQFQMRLQSMEVAARALLREKFGAMELTEDEIKAAYDKHIADLDSREYKARHILVKTADEAKAIIDALRNGADFATLAKERSTGPTGKNGGDLGWFQKESMVPEFATAVAKMQPGDISVEPVRTQFGYHVIKLEDTRELEKPTLDALRQQIQQAIMGDRITQYVEGIKDKAIIERK